MKLNLENMCVTPLSHTQAVSVNGGSWGAFKWAVFAFHTMEELVAGIQEGWSDADKSIDEQFKN